MKQEIFFVTGNSGKFKEVKTYIEKYVPEIELKQLKVDITEIQSMDQKEICIDKALKAWSMIKKPLIVDDGAIYFEKYNKFPGTMTKYVYEGLGFDGILKLVDNGDKAYFLLQIAYIKNPDNIILFEGKSEGTIRKFEKFNGDPSLPYASIFVPTGSNKIYEELRNTKEGEPFMHRIKALKAFVDWYKQEA
ncbi:hypothetical protein KJ644_03630 [Candidatus Dependentiae bacterium]|nr:hypothetical protein [Candidatus Dependentiae bacterium]MBU4387538.1 hypothetical protein [Candidatus Dependentiae bacterium]MCG2756802.1 hypothetical protein [Candidatus Dependentiae bacterium]